MAESPPLKNPFVGLRAYEEHEDYLFFGRSAEINDLLKKFSSSRFLAVIGSSGSGKSSLVKSGLLPAIYSGFLSVGRNWRVALFRPGNDPIGNMADELSREGVLYEKNSDAEVPYSTITETALRRSGSGLIQVYNEAHLAPTENLLIVIDQFEELFRFNRYEEAANEGKSDALNFVNLLLTATQQKDVPIYVLLTMRSDFIGDCAQFRGLPEAINDGQYLVPRMTRDEIREAITGPIAVGGAKIAPRLLTRLLNDVGNNVDQLPILQHAMMRTWDAWQMKDKPKAPIDIEDYEKIGGMSTALSLHAEEAYAELKTDKQRLTCEILFKALTDKAADVRGTRRPTSVGDLSTLSNSTPEDVIYAVEIFRRPGRTFLMPPPDIPLDKKSIIDISHESIMRVWQRLIKWTDEEAQSAEIYLGLSEDARRYKEGKKDLWRNPELAIGLRWYKDNKPTAKWAERYDKNFDESIGYLIKSKEAARRRIILLRIVATVIILGLTTLTGISYYQMRKADREKLRADTLRTLAHDSSLLAIDNAKKAHDSSLLAIAAAASAHDSSLLANAAAKRADSNASVAISEKEKVKRKNDTLNQTYAAIKKKNSEIAASEYQRRIREGPTDEKRLIDSGWNYKYVAYCHHLDSLKNYLGVASAVKKNSELYDKLYYSFMFGKSDKNYPLEKLKPENPTGTGSTSETFQLKNGGQVTFSNDRNALVYNNGKIFYTSQNRISAVAFTNDSHALIATEDNVLTVCSYDANKNCTVENTIPMGAQVTALDYYDPGHIIFFGLKTGEIGFINYKKDRRNQPIYRNQMDSKVSAIEFFEKDSVKDPSCYLLVSSSRGTVVMFELGSSPAYLTSFLEENKKLTGIELPENFGEIRMAQYLNNKVKLVTSRGTFLWNPFAEDLLKQLTADLSKQNNSLLDSTIAKTLLY